MELEDLQDQRSGILRPASLPDGHPHRGGAGEPAGLTFGALISSIQAIDSRFGTEAVRAVNLSLSLRNWCFGLYLAEFELRGADRARYGERLLDEIARELKHLGISNAGRRQLYRYMAFYRAYPKIVRTLSAQSLGLFQDTGTLEEIVRAVSAQSALSAESLLSRLSYSHFELLLEFLGIKPREAMAENDLEDALLDRVQEFLLELGRGFCFEARKNHALIEYALAGMDSRLFVSRYQIELPKKEELEQFLETELKEQGAVDGK